MMSITTNDITDADWQAMIGSIEKIDHSLDLRDLARAVMAKFNVDEPTAKRFVRQHDRRMTAECEMFPDDDHDDWIDRAHHAPKGGQLIPAEADAMRAWHGPTAMERFKRDWLFNVAADISLPSSILVFARALCDLHPSALGIHHTDEGMENVAGALDISVYAANRYVIKLVQNRHLLEPDQTGWCQAVIMPLRRSQRQKPMRERQSRTD